MLTFQIVDEASESLGLVDQMQDDWARIDEIKKEITVLEKSLRSLKSSHARCSHVINSTDDKLKDWQKLATSLETGEEVFAPSVASKKRKRSRNAQLFMKKWLKTEKSKIDQESQIASEASDDAEDMERQPVSMEEIKVMISQLREGKSAKKFERETLEIELQTTNEKLAALRSDEASIQAAMRATCIEGRNKFSTEAIQQDFAAGHQELDQEDAEQEDDFDPAAELKNYDEEARLLPVFCCSSRAYQKLSGRMHRESNVPGFRSKHETQIPMLQRHCQKLTEDVRISNCRRFLNNV